MIFFHHSIFSHLDIKSFIFSSFLIFFLFLFFSFSFLFFFIHTSIFHMFFYCFPRPFPYLFSSFPHHGSSGLGPDIYFVLFSLTTALISVVVLHKPFSYLVSSSSHQGSSGLGGQYLFRLFVLSYKHNWYILFSSGSECSFFIYDNLVTHVDCKE